MKSERNIQESAFKYTRDISPKIRSLLSPIVGRNFELIVYRTYVNGHYTGLFTSRVDFYKDFICQINDNGKYYTKEYQVTPEDGYHYFWFSKSIQL
ncbi:MAG: hypothetical protein RLN62_07085 [Rickettsiales bacterium]